MSEVVDRSLRRIGITISKPVLAVICIVVGLVLIIIPNIAVYLLALIVGIFLIVQGALMLTDYFEMQRQQQKPSSSSA